jgi:putative hemolysin
LETVVLIKLIVLGVLLLFSAFFSGSETALFSLGSVRLEKLKESGHPKAGVIGNLLERPRRLLISILLGNELVNITASAIAASICISLLGTNGKWVAIAVMTPLILTVGEIVPKATAIYRAEEFSRVVARPLTVFAQAIFPVRWVIRRIVDGVLKVFGSHTETHDSIFREEEIRDLVDVGHQEGVLEKQERELIHRVFRFGDTIVASVMTPKAQIFSLPLQQDADEILAEVKEEQYSRVPIYSGKRTNIVGILNRKDLLTLALRGKEHDKDNIRRFLRPPHFVPQSKKIAELLREFQKHKTYMAIVVDEYGHCIGLVTVEDLLEEIFGEIYDETDAPPPESAFPGRPTFHRP